MKMWDHAFSVWHTSAFSLPQLHFLPSTERTLVTVAIWRLLASFRWWFLHLYHYLHPRHKPFLGRFWPLGQMKIKTPALYVCLRMFTHVSFSSTKLQQIHSAAAATQLVGKMASVIWGQWNKLWTQQTSKAQKWAFLHLKGFLNS